MKLKKYMDGLNDILERVYFENTLYYYLVALGIIIAGFVIVALFKRVVVAENKALDCEKR